jgi:gas vesicle protein
MKTKDKMLGAGIGLAALAAAGTYFLYGKRGSRNRAAIEGWALQLKGEVLEKMEKLKDINQQAYNELVEETAERYGRVKRVSASELKLITSDLKNAWTHIGKQLKSEVR